MRDEFLSREERKLVEKMLKKIMEGDTRDFISIDELEKIIWKK